jgi:2,3-bisphosphoglycerate-dependent phosphoglycerate mutase/probable phosphoglycerate mutase
VTLRRLVLWRHGETDYNVGRRMQGQLDSKLSPLGIEQARRAAPVLAGFAPQALLTSDLARASDTAAVLAHRTGLVGCARRTWDSGRA